MTCVVFYTLLLLYILISLLQKFMSVINMNAIDDDTININITYTYVFLIKVLKLPSRQRRW